MRLIDDDQGDAPAFLGRESRELPRRAIRVEAMDAARDRSPEEIMLVCLSGRGDKDAAEIARLKDGSH